MEFWGEIAALSTAVLWSFTSIFFTSASKRIGSYHLNKIRIPAAVIFLSTMLLILDGRLVPSGVSQSSYFFLILSGIIGLSLGDLCLFSAFVILGTRKTLLIGAVTPILTTIIAWFLMGETLGFFSICCILLTIGGIWWVISERQSVNGIIAPKDNRQTLGILLAFGGALGQATGLVLAKMGMADSLAPLPATFIRMVAATIAVWLIGLIRRDNMATLKKLKDIKSGWLILGGSICGPFLGVWLSLVAVKNTEAGIAAAIMATVPVLVLPLVILFYKEKVSFRALFGAVVAVIGVVLIFLY
ncbi:MAG: DMT family transporter [Candidatus Zixiibacteriota bacterium]